MGSEIEPSEYPAYRARLARVLYWVWTGFKLWGQWVWLDRWTEFSGDELRKKFGRRWSLKLAYHCRLTRYEIVGVCEDGATVPLSEWKVKELRREGRGVTVGGQGAEHRAFRDVDAIAGQLQVVPGLGEGELACHLRDHTGLTPSLTIRVMRRMGYEGVDMTNLAKKRGYGAERIRKGRPCRACEAEANGRIGMKTEVIR